MTKKATPQKHPRVAHFMPYRLNDSPTGNAMAHRLKYKYADQDGHVLSDGFLTIKHWGTPSKDGFTFIINEHGKKVKDPHPKKALTARSWAEVSRLRNRFGGWRYFSVEHHMRLLKKYGITMCFEAKGDHAFEKPEPWERLMRRSKETGCEVIAMTLLYGAGGNALKRLEMAHKAGFRTALLVHNWKKPPQWAKESQYVDAVWGTWRRK